MNIDNKNKHTEIYQILNRLHVKTDDLWSDNEMRRLNQWERFAEFIIDHPKTRDYIFKDMLVSILNTNKRHVCEYVDCAIAWGVLEREEILRYNERYPNSKEFSETVGYYIIYNKTYTGKGD